MSRISAVLAASQTLSMTGFEEASRFDRATADLDDLLIALVRDDGAGGQALRAAGLTLAGARGAISATHAEQLRGIGVDIAPPGRGNARLDGAGARDWSPRAARVLQNAPASRAFSLSVLRTLLDEPSGFISEVLARSDVDTTALQHAMQASAEAPSGQTYESTTHLRESAAAFVAASPADVWRWLIAPDNVAHWSGANTRIAPTGADDVWEAHALERTADGKPSHTKPALRRRRVHLIERACPIVARWELDFPDAPRANTQIIGFELAPAAGGTRLTVTVEWVNRSGVRRSPLARLLRPLMRRVTRFQARTTGYAVAAHFADR